jgi:hypothetical protein
MKVFCIEKVNRKTGELTLLCHVKAESKKKALKELERHSIILNKKDHIVYKLSKKEAKKIWKKRT